MPEDRRGKNTTWEPSIEGAALGIAAARHSPDEVALVGPSAARAQRCYPRALGTAFVAVPDQRRPRQTILGEIRFVERHIDKLDTVRVETDLGPGWATSIEQNALDLCRNRPAWNITDEARTEMIRRLADAIDWDLVDGIAEATRGVKTLAEILLAMEVSWGIGPGDVERAVARAGLLSTVGVETLPVVAGSWITPEAGAKATDSAVAIILGGTSVNSAA